MDLHLGKLFIGGISWDTDECRLKEYFSSYGEVVEAVIMRDRASGRARGFGFVVFSDPAIAERVVLEKHMIDGRTVEAKKAVPRDDQQVLLRNNGGSLQGSPGPGRTKKIFVGGLPSSVTERDFKKYFDQYGTITDVVVMYDHNTQRPRGFGFITYDCEEAVDRALFRTFHELNGKLVEVKRAVPKELSLGPIRSPLTTGYSYGFSRAILNSYPQGFNLSPIGGYGVRMDGRYSPFNRPGFSPFGSVGVGFGVGMNIDGGPNVNFGGNSNFGNSISYGRLLNPYYGANNNRYATPTGYGGINIQNDPFINSPARNAWIGGGGGGGGGGGVGGGVGGLSASANSFINSGNGSFGMFENNGLNWGPSPLSPQGNGLGHMGYGNRESHYRLRGSEFGGNNIRNMVSSGISEGDFYGNDPVYVDPTWRSVSSEINAAIPYGYGADGTPDVSTAVNKGSEGYIGHYNNLPHRQTNRGIIA